MSERIVSDYFAGPLLCLTEVCWLSSEAGDDKSVVPFLFYASPDEPFLCGSEEQILQSDDIICWGLWLLVNSLPALQSDPLPGGREGGKEWGRAR